MAEFWDEWRGSLDGRPTMFIKRLLHIGGCRLDLHKFVSADDADCFHTHPAYAWRLVLWGGYEEQIDVGAPLGWYRFWTPGNFGIVRPDYCHRISRVLNGIASYSLWLRAPAKYEVHLRGDGWEVQRRRASTAGASK